MTERLSLRNSRALRWSVVAGLAAMVGVGLVLLFLLTQATNNREMYERNYTRLFTLNVVVASLLLVVIFWIAYRLMRRLRQRKFGSRLLVKLAAVFALAGFAPGMLIYVVSYQFVSRSIESWFDVKVEGALEAGLSLGRSTLETLSKELATKTRATAEQLADTSDASATLALERAREQLGASEVLLWSGSGQLISASGQTNYQLNTDKPTQSQFKNARLQRTTTWIEGLDDAVPGAPPSARIKALVLVSRLSVGLMGEQRFLQVTKGLAVHSCTTSRRAWAFSSNNTR